mmetsp:Transcript_18202/g.37955  ORF Transcript_18202/g.37955 Transcript_18202/m.37955 type:complete len:80 (-) Transcript_18202:1190-1429(-)
MISISRGLVSLRKIDRMSRKGTQGKRNRNEFVVEMQEHTQLVRRHVNPIQMVLSTRWSPRVMEPARNRKLMWPMLVGSS